MTYNYHYDIATSRAKVIFRLIFRWKGSVWSAVYIELIIWLVVYGIISLIYRLALDTAQQRSFEKFANFCDVRLRYIPMDFMLGFFVTAIVNRWTTQFSNLGLIDNISLFTSAFVKGNDERGRNIRRNIVRYCVLAQTLVFRDIHLGVRRRYPTLETMVAAGIMQDHELEKLNGVKTRYAKYWLPFNWALHLLNVAKDEGRIEGDIPRDSVSQEIRTFRTGLSLIWTYDWVPLPVMYPQLIFLAVHAYFLVCTIARQFIITPGVPNTTPFDPYFPIMSCVQFICYVGWVKVAMSLLNPFGEDEDDFDCNFLLDRNLTVSLCMVDDAFDDIPEVQPDMFWEDTVNPLYSEASTAKAVNFYVGSATRQELPESMTQVTMVPHPMNEMHDHYNKNPARRRRTSIVSISKQQRSVANGLRPRNGTGNSLFNGNGGIFGRKATATSNVSHASSKTETGGHSNPSFPIDMEDNDDDSLERF